ncbi:MAG: DnaJ family molecular chaperone [Syntrophobacteraceae bacterium]
MVKQSEKISDNDFKILGLHPNASRVDVKKAYRDLVKRWHPDRFQQGSASERIQAEDKLKQITAAYRRVAATWNTDEHTKGRAKRQETSAPRRDAYEEKTSKGFEGSGTRSESGGSSSQRPLHTVVNGLRALAREWRSAHPMLRHSVALFVALFAIIFALTSVPTLEWLHWPLFQSPERNTTLSADKDNANRRSWPSSSSTSTSKDPAQNEGKESLESVLPPDTSGTPFSGGTGMVDGVHFTIGSTQADVFRIQGVPDEIRGQTWVYGLSEVVFRDGLVSRYYNFDGTLKVSLLSPNPSPDPEFSSFFTLGATAEQVISVQGTPTRIEGNRWFYGFSEIRFKEGRVAGFENFFGNLKIRMLPTGATGKTSGRDYFTIGSSCDDVLSVQGTPTTIRGNMWFYNLSNILFRNGKVHYVFNTSGNLHFLPADEQASKE